MSSPNRDIEHLAKLRRYYTETRRIPSLARIGELMGFSTPAAKKFIERLAGEGFVTRTPDDDAWVPSTRFFERPLVEASVQAGNPVAVEAVPAEPVWPSFDVSARRPPAWHLFHGQFLTLLPHKIAALAAVLRKYLAATPAGN